MTVAVSDASALIALDRIRLLETMAPLLDGLLIPPAVAHEIAPTVRVPAWCSVRGLAQEIPESVRREGLGHGETEAIALSIESDRCPLILDERRARRLAISLGLPIVGTAGLLVRAKREGLLDVVRPHLEALIETGFFVSPNVVERALRQAGELR
jgi:predicted nucleic acid-binding protein